MENLEFTTLDGEESAMMEGPITEDEIKIALKEMDSNRSPGP